MDRTRLVSVVVPFLNAERFLEEAIASVFTQTYADWELLLVDDGSTDASTTIAQDAARKHPERARYFEHEGHRNLGASVSRNLAVSQAAGSYIAFLDADDVWLPEKLERQVPILDSHREAAMVYSSTEYWYSWTGKPEDAGRDWIWDHFGVTPNTLIEPPTLLTTFLRDGGTVPCVGGTLLRRAAYLRVGGYEPEFRYIYTDQAFYGKLCLTEPVYVAPGCWDRYRQHAGSSCHKVATAGQQDAARTFYLEWLERYLRSRGVRDPALWRALRAALRPYRYPTVHALEQRARHEFGHLTGAAKAVGRRLLPATVRRWMRDRWRRDEIA